MGVLFSKHRKKEQEFVLVEEQVDPELIYEESETKKRPTVPGRSFL